MVYHLPTHTYPDSPLSKMSVTCRNPSPQPLLAHTVKYLIDVACHTPSKNSQAYFEIIVSEDMAFHRHQLYEACRTQDPDPTGDYANIYNPQMLAPLLIIYNELPPSATHPEYVKNETDMDWTQDARIAMGISMGVVAHSAARLGLNIGYCGCIDATEWRQAWSQRLPDHEWRAPQIVCVSQDQHQPLRTHPLQPGRIFESQPKQPISIHRWQPNGGEWSE